MVANCVDTFVDIPVQQQVVGLKHVVGVHAQQLTRAKWATVSHSYLVCIPLPFPSCSHTKQKKTVHNTHPR